MTEETASPFVDAQHRKYEDAYREAVREALPWEALMAAGGLLVLESARAAERSESAFARFRARVVSAGAQRAHPVDVRDVERIVRGALESRFHAAHRTGH
jgi:hypothetical protein